MPRAFDSKANSGCLSEALSTGTFFNKKVWTDALASIEIYVLEKNSGTFFKNNFSALFVVAEILTIGCCFTYTIKMSVSRNITVTLYFLIVTKWLCFV